MPVAPDLSGCALEGRYELLAVIGEGAFGRVYRGHDRRLEREVAVKLIKPWWAEDPDWVRSFEREAQLLARVSDPGIVQIFDVGRAEEGLYYVSELIDGESLASRLVRGPLPVWEAARVAEQLCCALARAHAQRVVHRDVKPANILITREGRVKVADFGVARLLEGSNEGAGGTVVGTPRYMAPEQARGQLSTPATDVYSAGVVLYEMIAGRPPFVERAAVELALRHLHDPPPPLPSSTPAALVAIVARALAKTPHRRYRDGGEMAGALGAAPRPSGALGPRARLPAAVGEARRPKPPASAPRPVHRQPPAGPGPEPTRRAPRLGPRRNLNPAARRRSLAALAAVFALLGAMITAALVLSGSGRVRVPRFVGEGQSRIESRARGLALVPSFVHRFSSAPLGIAIAQRPAAGHRLAQGATVRVTLSSGPPPVPVPQLAGQSLESARSELARLGLRIRTTLIAAPGVPGGTVTSQSPAPGVKLARTGRVALYVAEVPRWRPVTALPGSNRSTSVSFRVRGGRWRIVYAMSYQGTCTFVIVCSGPSATISGPGGSGSSFDLGEGPRQTQSFATGPGQYRLTISPGSDTARFSAWVEDWY